MWGGYIDHKCLATHQTLARAVMDIIERQVGNFHSERMNSPSKPSSQVLGPTVSQISSHVVGCLEIPCVPGNSATSKHSFSKVRHLVRARQAKLLDEYVKQLTFCPGTRTYILGFSSNI